MPASLKICVSDSDPEEPAGRVARRLASKLAGHPFYPVKEMEAAVRAHLYNLQLLEGSASPSPAGSFFFSAGNVDYVAYRDEKHPSKFELFATVYHLPAGIIDLEGELPPNQVILGYTIDFCLISAWLRKLSPASVSFRRLRERLWPKKKKKILLWGFINNLGHHLWNEHGGLDLLMGDGALDKVDQIILGPFDFFDYGKYFEGRVPVLRSREWQPPFYSSDIVLRSADVTFGESTRRRVLAWAGRHADGSPLETWKAAGEGRPVVCIQIRRHQRRWLEEITGVAEIIKATAVHWPEARFIIDGMSLTAGSAMEANKHLEAELEASRMLVQSLPAHIAVHCSIGEDLNAKVRAFGKVDLFIAPIGSGNTLSSWLLRRPTIVYGPTGHYPFCRNQEKIIPEGGGTAVFVPESHITDATDQDYHLDWRIVADIAHDHLRQHMTGRR